MNNRIIDCDVFCTEDFTFDGEVVITGNFYANSSRIEVAGIEAGGDIILDSPAKSSIKADFLYALGCIEGQNYDYVVNLIYADQGVTFRYEGPATIWLPFDVFEELDNVEDEEI